MTAEDLISQSGGPGWFVLLQRRYINSSLKSQMLSQLAPLQTATKAFCNKLAEVCSHAKGAQAQGTRPG